MDNHDVLLVMTDERYTFSPITKKAKCEFERDFTFTPKQAEFFVAANLAHFENIGLTLKIDDKRSNSNHC
jgi:hypothetical protein